MCSEVSNCNICPTALAFSDWSEMQKTRREMLRDHTFPRAFTARFHQLDTLLNEELLGLCTVLREGSTNIKPLLLQTCANVFMAYFCSIKFSSDDEDFVKMVRKPFLYQTMTLLLKAFLLAEE